MITRAFAATGPAGAPAAGSSFPPFDASTFGTQLFWLVLCFGLLYWLMSRIGLPRVAGIIEDRAARIAKDLDDASAAKTRARDAGAAYEKQLAEARAKSQAIAQAARDRAAKAADERRKVLEADLAAKLTAAEATITATKNAALGNVGAIAEEATAAIVEQLTGKAPGAAAVKQAVDAAMKG